MKRDELVTEIERELARIRISDGEWGDGRRRETELKAALRDLNERVFGPDLHAYVAERRRRPSLAR